MTSLVSREEAECIIRKDFIENFIELTDPKVYTVLRDVEVKEDDVFLLGIAKSGTTWLQELVWLIGNDLDFEGANKFIDERVPVLELGLFMNKGTNYNETSVQALACHYDSLNYISKMKSPRYIKSHVPPDYLPTKLLSGENTKIIYISRNVKDTCLSSYHYSKNVLNLHKSSLDDFCKVFIGFDSTYWKSVLYFWNVRNKENILFLRYEDMKTNLREVIQRVAKFLDKSVTKDQEEKLLDWLHFDKMKTNNALNHNNIYEKSDFMRTGKIGDHKEEMCPEIISLFDSWIEESLKNSDYVEYK